ncbi:MAG: glycosyltransferase family 2 protein [Anaerolineae bacterium]|jgi:hypothetical protein
MSDDEQQSLDITSAKRDPAISVVVYTLNDAETIEWCLSSLVDQKCACCYEIIVVDDCSRDGTPELIALRFPQVKLVGQESGQGWIVALRRALSLARGETLAFLGAHCAADTFWLATVEAEMSACPPVITGRGRHGEGRFLERFEALSVHPDYLDTVKGEVAFLWDDNFAIRPSVLEDALPDTGGSLSDGAGATLLSLELGRQGIPIRYRPSFVIDHATHSLRTIVGFWHGEMAENAIAIKLADPSLPLARRLWLGPMAAAILAAGGFWHGARAMLRKRHSLHVSLPEVVVHSCLLVCMMPGYFLGLCREIARNWNQIRRRL